jgi:hypothetical protein
MRSRAHVRDEARADVVGGSGGVEQGAEAILLDFTRNGWLTAVCSDMWPRVVKSVSTQELCYLLFVALKMVVTC